MNNKLKIIAITIASLMGTTVYADDTENNTDKKQSQVQEVESSSSNKNNKKLMLSSSPNLLGSSSPSDIIPFSNIQQQIKTVHQTVPGLSVNFGKLNYSKKLYSIKANYGKNNFDLALDFYQQAPASYTGGFSGRNNNNPHPFGFSAYMINHPGYAKSSTGFDSGNDFAENEYFYVDPDENASAIWGFNLPALYINTAPPSEYYGDNKNKHTALLSLGNVNYQLIIDYDDDYDGNIWYPKTTHKWIASLVKQMVVTNKPKVMYSKNGEKLIFSFVPKDDTDSAEIDTDSGEICVTTPDGTRYYFEFQKFMNGGGTNKYNIYDVHNYNDGTSLPGVFIFQINRIVYPNGSGLNFAYTINKNNAYALTDIQISDDNHNILSEIKHENTYASNASAHYSTVYGRINNELKPIYKIYYQSKVVDFDNYGIRPIQIPRVTQVDDLLDSANTVKYEYQTDEGSSNPDQPGNVTYLTSITNERTLSNGAKYTSKAEFDYLRLEQRAQLSDGDNFEMYSYFVKDIKYFNSDFESGSNPKAIASYIYKRNDIEPTLMSPYTKGVDCDDIINPAEFNCEGDESEMDGRTIDFQYPFGGGFNPWMDNLFYMQNKDDDHVFYSLITPKQNFNIDTYTTVFSSSNNPIFESVDLNTYDALQRLVETKNYYNLNHNRDSYYTNLTTYEYGIYMENVGSGKPYDSFDSLPGNYNKPTEIKSYDFVSVVNGNIIPLIKPLETLTRNSFDPEGNITSQRIYKGFEKNLKLQSNKAIFYLPASETYPVHIKRLPSESIIYDNDSSEFKSTKYSYTTISNENLEGDYLYNLPVNKYSALSSKELSRITNTGDNPITSVVEDIIYKQSNDPVLHGMVDQDLVKFKATSVSPDTIIWNLDTTKEPNKNENITISSNSGSEGLYRSNNKKVISFDGVLLEEHSPLGQITTYQYDEQGRDSGTTIFYGTSKQKSTKIIYNSPSDLALDSSALYSVRNIDIYGNISIILYNARQQEIATYEQLVGVSSPVKTSENIYNNSLGQLIQSISYESGTAVTTNYYYNDLQQRVAVVPEIGLSTGIIYDGINNNTITFNYKSDSDNPTKISKIYGNVYITQKNKLTDLKTFLATISQNIANQYLANIDLKQSNSNTIIVNGNDANNFYQEITINGEVVQSAQSIQELSSLYNNLTSVDGINLIALTSFKYDNWNRLSSKTVEFRNDSDISSNSDTEDLVSQTTKYEYLDDDSKITVTQPNGNIETRYFNHRGEPIKTTLLVDGVLTTLNQTVYNSLGLPINSTDINGENKNTYLYNENWQLTSKTNAKGIVTSLVRDPVTEQVIKLSSGNMSTNYTYNNFGDLLSIIDQDGNKVENTYYSNGLLNSSTTTYAGDKSYSFDYQYNNLGRIESVYSPFLANVGTNIGNINGRMYFIYDKYNRLINQHYGVLGNNSLGYSNTISYDNSAFPYLPTSKAIKSSEKFIINTNINYEYNDLGKLVSKSFTTGDMNIPNTINYKYNQNGMLTQKEIMAGGIQGYINPNITSYLYDNYGRLIYLDQNYLGKALNNTIYEYNNYNNIITTTKRSDAQGLLTSSKKTYKYNDLNNPFRLTSVNNNLNGVETSGTLTYDQTGNVTKNYDGSTFTYNDLDKVSNIKKSSQTQAEIYKYGPNGNIISEYSPITNSTSKTYYNGDNVVAKLLNGRFYVNTPYGQATKLDLDYLDTSNMSLEEKMNILNTIENSSMQKIFFRDGNSIIGMYNDESPSTVLERFNTYTPYGIQDKYKENYSSDIKYPLNIQDSKTNTIYGYNGQLTDTNTGYQFLGNGTRLYDPTLGRFLQSDPAKSGLNWYAYANNNPIMYNDPTGLFSVTKEENGYTSRYKMPETSWQTYVARDMTNWTGNKFADAFLVGMVSGVTMGMYGVVAGGFAMASSYTFGETVGLSVLGVVNPDASMIMNAAMSKKSSNDKFYAISMVAMLGSTTASLVDTGMRIEHDLKTNNYEDLGLIGSSAAGQVAGIVVTLGLSKAIGSIGGKKVSATKTTKSTKVKKSEIKRREKLRKYEENQRRLEEMRGLHKQIQMVDDEIAYLTSEQPINMAKFASKITEGANYRSKLSSMLTRKEFDAVKNGKNIENIIYSDNHMVYHRSNQPI